MQKLSWILQVLLVFTFPVYAEDEMDMIIESAKELKGIGATKIIWKKDRAKMAATPALDTLESFWIDTTKVTVGQFKKFLELSKPAEHIYWNDVTSYSPTDSHPMSYVSWHDATAYAKWAGKRLPTEKE